MAFTQKLLIGNLIQAEAPRNFWISLAKQILKGMNYNKNLTFREKWLTVIALLLIFIFASDSNHLTSREPQLSAS